MKLPKTIAATKAPVKVYGFRYSRLEISGFPEIDCFDEGATYEEKGPQL